MNRNLFLLVTTLYLAYVACFALGDSIQDMVIAADARIRVMRKESRKQLAIIKEDLDEIKHEILSHFHQKRVEFEQVIENEKAKAHHDGVNIIECIVHAKEAIRNISREALHNCDDTGDFLTVVSRFVLIANELADVKVSPINCRQQPAAYESCVQTRTKEAVDRAQKQRTAIRKHLRRLDKTKYKNCYHTEVTNMRHEIVDAESKLQDCVNKHKE